MLRIPLRSVSLDLCIMSLRSRLCFSCKAAISSLSLRFRFPPRLLASLRGVSGRLDEAVSDVPGRFDEAVSAVPGRLDEAVSDVPGPLSSASSSSSTKIRGQIALNSNYISKNTLLAIIYIDKHEESVACRNECNIPSAATRSMVASLCEISFEIGLEPSISCIFL